MTRALPQLASILLLGCCVGPGCAGQGKEKPGQADAVAAGQVQPGEAVEESAEAVVENPLKTEVILGEVTYVDRGAGFLLLRSSPSAQIAPGEKLESRTWAGDTTGNLVLSSERKRQFLIADIADGTPSVGDLIYIQVEMALRNPGHAPRHDTGTRGTRKNTRKGGLKRS